MIKAGKLPENILKRSVIKRIHTRDSRAIKVSGVGLDAAVVSIPKEQAVCLASGTAIVSEGIDIDRAVIGTINNIYAQGGYCINLQVSVTLPPSSEESELRFIMNRLNDLCKERDIFISGGHTLVSDQVNMPVVNITAVGNVDNSYAKSCKAKVGDDIVVTKWVGLDGSSLIARLKERELKERFSPSFIDRAMEYMDLLDISREAQIAKENGAGLMHDASTGGIFGALWELGEIAKLGMEVDLLAIPLRQETVEICEYYELNPYELSSGGCLVITTPDGEGLVDALNDAQIEATIIGKITAGNEKLVILNDEKRFLEPRRNEELYKIIYS